MPQQGSGWVDASQVRPASEGWADASKVVTSQQPDAPASEPDSWGKWLRDTAASIGVNPENVNMGIGIAKSALGTIKGGGDLLRKIPGVSALDNAAGGVTLPIQPQPQGQTQQIGKALGDVAQLMAPAGALSKVKAALATGSGVLDALIGAGAEAMSGGAIGAAQSGDLATGATSAVLTGGGALAAQAALKGANALGQRIELSLIKPLKADISDGFKIQNVFKHGLGGTLSQSYDKAGQAIGKLSSQLQTAIQSDPNARVNVYQALFDAADDLDKSALKNVADQGGIKRGLETMLDNIGEAMKNQGVKVASDGSVDIASANLLKQGVGEAGAWLHDPSGRIAVDADAVAKEKIANAYYATLKQAIEATPQGPQIKALNQQLAEIIPIRHALIRRIPVAQRHNVLNLGDMIGFGTGSIGLAIANRLLQSGRMANVLVGAGQSGAAPVIGRVGAGLLPKDQEP